MAVGILHLYKGILQLCALVFAFQTRKVKIEGLNDTKYITAFVYTTSIILAMTFIASLVLYDYINIHALVYSFGIWLAISAVLGFMFIPKVGITQLEQIYKLKRINIGNIEDVEEFPR